MSRTISLTTKNSNSSLNSIDATQCEEECYENKKEIAFWICFGAVLTLSGVFILLSTAPTIKQLEHQLNPDQCHLIHATQINCSYAGNCSCAQPFIYFANIASRCNTIANHTFKSRAQCIEYQEHDTVSCSITHCNATSFNIISKHDDDQLQDAIMQFIGGCLVIICGCCTYPCVLWMEKKRRPKPQYNKKIKRTQVSSSRSARMRGTPRIVVELPVLLEDDEIDYDEGEALFSDDNAL